VLKGLLLRGAVLSVFLVSGAAGLAYEVVWTRSLSLIFGVTAFAAATVLAAFMGGLALGSWALGRGVDRQKHPLLVYAVLETGIGLYALLVPTLFESLQGPYLLLHRLDLPSPVFGLARALLAGLVVLVPTALMGGTFPVLVRFFVRSHREVGVGTATLYAVNTTGAIAGCLLAGFVLIERLGLTGTTRLAAAANLAAAATAAVLSWMLASKGGAEPAGPRDAEAAGTAEGSPLSTAEGSPLSAATRRLVLVCIGLSGFAALGYEVLWTRALLRYLYNSTYAFTTMLATFLMGIAIGSAIYALLRGRIRRPLLAFAALELLAGFGFVASGLSFEQMGELSGAGSIRSFADSLGVMFVRAASILLLPTIFLGAALPLATELCTRGLSTLGDVVGRVYAVNTFGAILGSLAAGFVLIPAVGMQGCLTALVAVNLACAAALAIAEAEGASRRALAAVVGFGLLPIPLLAIPSDLFRRTFAPPNENLVFYREGATDTVGVVDGPLGRNILYEDRRGTAGTWTYRWNFFFGHLPLLLHPGVPKSVLNICFGVGNSLSAAASHGSVERITSVELSPHVIDAAGYFWTNNGVASDPRVRIVIDDGRNFVLTDDGSYDVIELEPPETFTAGVINLYTREFYRDAAARLAPEGVLIQWLPVGEAPLEQEKMLFRAFTDVFPEATAWRQLEDGAILLVGSRQPLRIDYQRLQERMREPRVARDLELIEIRDADHLLSFFTLDPPALEAFVRGVEPVTEDRTVLDFSMPRFVGSGFGLGSLNPIAEEGGRNPGQTFNERMQYYFAQRRSVLPHLEKLQGEDPAAVEARIAAHARLLPFPAGGRVIPETDWRRP
jgi:spermidine synthase